MKEVMLSIMEIERFAIHDGPGIRTIVFLQGCPLSCSWCSNPESQKMGTHLLYMENKCIGCGRCYKSCPNDSIDFTDGRPVFNRNKCIFCKNCAAICPQDAIKFIGEKISVAEIMEKVCRDKDYYYHSGGGVTISGGEPFVQCEGLIALLRRCKSEGLHTAIETSGQADTDKIKKALPLVDLFLFDIKHTDTHELKKETRADLELIWNNLRTITAFDAKKVIIRVPVLPGFNHKPDIIRKIYDLALELNIREVHLLPYHTLGKDKYKQLGMPYTFSCDRILTNNELIPLKEMGEKMNLIIKAGG
jgi:pyruvate formate lyase activating enzyme